MNKQPRILIIDTQPYNKMVQSRALESYFHQFDYDNLAQVFSDARTPCKGHCNKLFQITDKRLFKARFSKKIKTGKVFLRDQLENEWKDMGQSSFKPKHKGPFYRLVRKWIWNKKYWDTTDLEDFVRDFKPDYIFVGFSKDFFIFDIAIHFAKKYDLPLILSIADDYVFFDEYHGEPFNKKYRSTYLKTIQKLMEMNVFCIFESEKIKQRYKKEFNVPGEVIYIASDIVPRKRNAYSLDGDWYYFGNLEFGRFDSINIIGRTLLERKIPNKIHVYSKDIHLINKKRCSPNVFLHDAVPYSVMMDLMEESNTLLIVEGFKEKDVRMVEYSLSTKVGDCIAFGKPIIAFGDKRCGAIDFLLEKKIGFVATNKMMLSEMIDEMFKLKRSYSFNQQYLIALECFSLEQQSMNFLKLFEKK